MKFKFVIVGKDNKFEMSDEQLKGICLEDASDDIKKSCECVANSLEFVKYSNNKEPLAVIYNRELNAERADRKHDFVVFLHADVKFDIPFFMSRCESCADKYDVMGLCGAEKINTNTSPLNWFSGSMHAPMGRWGCVTHGENGNQLAFFSEDRKEITDHAVAAIDGLCIVFGKKALDSEMLFDEQFTFNQYDTDISFQTLITYGLRLGVVVEPHLQHYSVGTSILSLEFLQKEVDFRLKWKLNFPDNSNVKKLLEARNAKVS